MLAKSIRISNALTLFRNEPNRIWSMEMINNWLSQNKELYNNLVNYKKEDESLPRLVGSYSAKVKFLNLYEELLELQRFYTKENTLKKRIKKIELTPNLKNRFYSSFIQEYTNFIINYLDTKVPYPYLDVFLFGIEEFNVRIKAKDFFYTIQYVNIMNKYLESKAD